MGLFGALLSGLAKEFFDADYDEAINDYEARAVQDYVADHPDAEASDLWVIEDHLGE